MKVGTVCYIDCCGNFIPQRFNGRVVTVTGVMVHALEGRVVKIEAQWLTQLALQCGFPADLAAPCRCLKPINPPGLDVTEKEDKPLEVPA